MSYQVIVTYEGRGGFIVYMEDGNCLKFEWEHVQGGVEIITGSAQEWAAICRKQTADRAIGRRQEILERIAQEYKRQKAKRAKIIMESDRIFISFEGYGLFAYLKSLFD
jgi:hypothetical protein